MTHSLLKVIAKGTSGKLEPKYVSQKLELSTVFLFTFLTFDFDQVTKLYRRCKKEHLTASKMATFENLAKLRNMALQIREILQTFVSAREGAKGSPLPPPPQITERL